MKRFFITLIVIIFCFSCSSKAKRKHQGNSDYQKEMNAKFKDASTSPLTKKDLKTFKGLPFFPIKNKFKVVAKLNKTKDSKIFSFPTTTERIAKYKKYGVVNFSIDEKNFSLDIYKDPNPLPGFKDYLFLPFFDKTNGKTTYKGGRFVDITTNDETKDGTILIDFNKAYNPYCVYNDKFSCPITPRENFLNIPIEAGMMNYK
ncbi:hypothetical protein BTO06_13565 [Tenacibaculum sp. SZ-18]|uniref:DUF1684 domain-containing protein n=1 Tax=Tenacibaculum sp. SZ-18 TaxID=754423 RepID=UPI000C2D46BE|nr:DUF1684 domain-containing protein [Tenacibaculum sp. SZ-18]AUC16122.1 hypothetical protein BTO06_13565 [Tenacibaculum sp. SZ-18]